MDNAKEGIPFKHIPGRKIVVDEVWQDRPNIAGYPLPWKLHPTAVAAAVVDADGVTVRGLPLRRDAGLHSGIIAALNRGAAIEEAAKALVARSFRSVKMSKSRSIQIECNDGDQGFIVHGADYDALVEALEASRS